MNFKNTERKGETKPKMTSLHFWLIYCPNEPCVFFWITHTGARDPGSPAGSLKVRDAAGTQTAIL